MRLERSGAAFTLSLAGRIVLRHDPADPFLFAGHGEPDVRMQNAYFSITDFVSERMALRDVSPQQTAAGWELQCSAPGRPALTVTVHGDRDHLRLEFAPCPGINRIWLRLPGEPGERSGAAANSSPIWTSQAGASPSGSPSPASAATTAPSSVSRRARAAGPARTGTPTIPSRR